MSRQRMWLHMLQMLSVFLLLLFSEYWAWFTVAFIFSSVGALIDWGMQEVTAESIELDRDLDESAVLDDLSRK